jgi:pimeloyl-ACP methyl ester carboxylesterase
MGEHVRAGTLDMWVERQGSGPDVLLIAGLGDPAEVWQFQLDGLGDRYRLTAYDNRGMGRTPLPAEPFSVPGSRSWPRKRTSPSRRSPTCSTPRSTPSGGRSRREAAPQPVTSAVGP